MNDALKITIAALSSALLVSFAQTPTYRLLHQDVVIDADLWTSRAEILSANYAFENIIGVVGGEASVRAAGGTWNDVACSNGGSPDRQALTSSVMPSDVALAFGQPVHQKDAIPVVFSWPLLPTTLGPSD